MGKERFYSLTNKLADVFDNVVENVKTRTIRTKRFDIYQGREVEEFKTEIYTTKIKIPYKEDMIHLKLNNEIVDYMFSVENDVMFIKFNVIVKLFDKITITYPKLKEEWSWTFGGEENYG